MVSSDLDQLGSIQKQFFLDNSNDSMKNLKRVAFTKEDKQYLQNLPINSSIRDILMTLF